MCDGFIRIGRFGGDISVVSIESGAGKRGKNLECVVVISLNVGRDHLAVELVELTLIVVSPEGETWYPADEFECFFESLVDSGRVELPLGEAGDVLSRLRNLPEHGIHGGDFVTSDVLIVGVVCWDIHGWRP